MNENFMNRLINSGSEANLHRTIFLKRLVSSPTKNLISKESFKMFDQFYIFGAPPDSNFPLRITLLTTYPSTTNSNLQSDEVIEQLKLLCFPSGFNKLKRDKNVEPKVLLNEFLFYLSGSNLDKTFGICVQFCVTERKSAFFATRYSRHYPFCLCFLSKAPYLSSHFQFASYLALVLCGKQVPIRSVFQERRLPLPIKGFCHESLTLDKNFPAVAVFKGFSMPKIIFEYLTYFHSLKENENDISSSIVPIQLSSEISLCIPFHLSRTQCLAYPTFQMLFSALSPSNIVKIYTAMLLERKILFISNDLQLASFSVIAAISLISPFITQATVFPMIPNTQNFQEILQSPFPYIAGSTKPHENAEVIVNLDTGTIHLDSPLPNLPRCNELVNKLETILKSGEKSILVPPQELRSFFGYTSPNPDYPRFMESANVYVFPSIFNMYSQVKYIFTPFVVEDILSLFNGILAPRLTDLLRSCFVTDTTDESSPITIMNKELLMCLVPPNEVAFYNSFISTQIFTDFCERKTDEYSESLLNLRAKVNNFPHSLSMPNMAKY